MIMVKIINKIYKTEAVEQKQSFAVEFPQLFIEITVSFSQPLQQLVWEEFEVPLIFFGAPSI